MNGVIAVVRFLGRVGGAVLKIPGATLANTIGALLPERTKRMIAKWGPLASTVILIGAGAGLIDLPAVDVLVRILGAPLENPDQLAQVGVTLAAIITAAFGIGQKAQNTVDEAEGKRDRIATFSKETETALASLDPKMLWIQRRARYLVQKGNRPHGQAVIQALREVHRMSAGDLTQLPVLHAGE